MIAQHLLVYHQPTPFNLSTDGCISQKSDFFEVDESNTGTDGQEKRDQRSHG